MAVVKLVDAGIVIRNQSVLLKGVNDSAEVLEELFKKLADIRVAPDYLYRLDLTKGMTITACRSNTEPK
jgi:lysine 2,3-aminomutase